MATVLGAVGSFCYRFRKTVVALWLLLVLILSLFAVQLPSVLKGSGFVMEGSYAEVNRLLKDEFGIYESTLLLTFEHKEGASAEQFRTAVTSTLQHIRGLGLAGMTDMAAPYPSEGVRPDPSMAKDAVAYAAVAFELPTDEMGPTIDAVRTMLKTEPQEAAVIRLTGSPVIEEDLNTASQHDLARAEMIGLPVALVVLLFAFGGLVAASLPLVVGLLSVLSAMGVLYFAGLQMELSVFLLNVVVMLGLALGIDFALLFVNRFRQELAERPVREAVVMSVRTAGESILFSGCCVLVGLAGMLFIRVDIFKAVALGGMTVVFFSVLTALTLLPALLSLLGPRINRFMLLKPRPERTSVWLRFAGFVMRRPLIMAVSALLLLVASMLPIRNMDLAIPGTDALPAGYESKQAYQLYEDTFTDKGSAEIVIIAETPGEALAAESLAAVARLEQRLAEDPLVDRTESLFSLAGERDPERLAGALESDSAPPALKQLAERMASGNYLLLRVGLATGPFDDATSEWLREWDRTADGVKLHIGGYAKFNQEIFDEIYGKSGYSLLLILGATYIILFLAFRSVLIPLKAIVMNALSLCATFGLIILIFQNGWFGVEPSQIALFIPIFIFSIVFGLSTDYEVFLISRIQEIYRSTGDNDRATLEGLALTSKIITSAAAIMVVITGAFAFTGVMPVKQLGVGIALAIFIDATIVRMVLVPSMMKLFGDWNWWAPKAFRRRPAQSAD